MINTTFLTMNFLAEYTPISSALGKQIDLINPFIHIAEQLHIYDVLGTALKDDLLTKIETNTLTAYDTTIVEQYIIPCSAWYTYYESILFIAYRSEAKGMTKKYSDNSQPLDKEEIKIYRQSILDKSVYYKNKLIQYLTDNESSFTLWRSTSTNPINKNKDNSTGIFLNF